MHGQNWRWGNGNEAEALPVLDKGQQAPYISSLNFCHLQLVPQLAEASPFWSVTTSMVDSSLDAQVVDNIVANLRDSYGDHLAWSVTNGILDQQSALGLASIQSTDSVEVCNLFDLTPLHC